jgi:hypothetical protein
MHVLHVLTILFCQIKVEREALDHVRDLYIDPSHVVFDLVPQPFGVFMEHCYAELGRPLVTRQTCWDVYLHLLAIVQASKEMIPRHIELYEEAEGNSTTLPLLENHQDLPDREDGNGGYYMGGVGGGLGLGMPDLFFDAMQIQTNIYVADGDLRQLESLARDDEPDITLGIDENAVGLDHAGLVVWEFSDGDDSDVPDEW